MALVDYAGVAALLSPSLSDNIDRIGQEPHQASSKLLYRILEKSHLVDVWRIKYQTTRRYTWIRMGGEVREARLDHFCLLALFF